MTSLTHFHFCSIRTKRSKKLSAQGFGLFKLLPDRRAPVVWLKALVVSDMHQLALLGPGDTPDIVMLKVVIQGHSFRMET